MFFNLVIQADCAEVFCFVCDSDSLWRLGIVLGIVLVWGSGYSVGVWRLGIVLGWRLGIVLVWRLGIVLVCGGWG